MASIRLHSRISLLSLRRAALPTPQRAYPVNCRGIRRVSDLATEYVSGLKAGASKATKNVAANLKFGETLDHAEISNQLTESINQEIESFEWIQKLLNEKEGGGYIVPQAGLLSHLVNWGDHDSFNHVNNVVYLKWFETARVNYFLDMTKTYPSPDFHNFMTGNAVGPIIRSVELAWRYPITFPDRVTVVHKLLPITEEDRFTLQGVVVSHAAKKVAARIKEVLVTVDYVNGGKKAPIPSGIRAAFEKQIELQNKFK